MIAEENARQRVKEELWSPGLRVSCSRRDNPMCRLDEGLQKSWEVLTYFNDGPWREVVFRPSFVGSSGDGEWSRRKNVTRRGRSLESRRWGCRGGRDNPIHNSEKSRLESWEATYQVRWWLWSCWWWPCRGWEGHRKISRVKLSATNRSLFPVTVNWSKDERNLSRYEWIYMNYWDFDNSTE